MKKKVSYLLISFLVSVFVISCGSSESNENNDKTQCFSSIVKNLNGDCKYIEVKSSPNDATDNRIMKIYYSIIPAKDRSIKKDPVVILVGGPGPSNTFATEDKISNGNLPYVNDGRDIIIMDYRGTGFTKPYPRCDHLFSYDEKGAKLDDAKTCFSNLEKENMKLSDYTTANIAYDLNKILEKEKIKKVILVGYSYGTRVASTMARDFPSKVSAMVLDGFFTIESNGISQAYESILDKLNDIAIEYDKAYPNEDNLRDRLEKVSNKVDEDVFQAIIRFALPNIVYDKNVSIVTKFLLDNPTKKNILALLIDETFDNDFRNRVIDNNYSYRAESSVMSLAIIMQEEYYFTKKQPFYDFGFKKNVINSLEGFQGGSPLTMSVYKSIESFFISKTPQKEMEALKSDIPTIILTGGLDQQTTKYWAINAQKYLSNSRHFFFPKQDHVLSMTNKNAQKIIKTFLNNRNDNFASIDGINGDDFHQLK